MIFYINLFPPGNPIAMDEKPKICECCDSIGTVRAVRWHVIMCEKHARIHGIAWIENTDRLEKIRLDKPDRDKQPDRDVCLPYENSPRGPIQLGIGCAAYIKARTNIEHLQITFMFYVKAIGFETLTTKNRKDSIDSILDKYLDKFPHKELINLPVETDVLTLLKESKDNIACNRVCEVISADTRLNDKGKALFKNMSINTVFLFGKPRKKDFLNIISTTL